MIVEKIAVSAQLRFDNNFIFMSFNSRYRDQPKSLPAVKARRRRGDRIKRCRLALAGDRPGGGSGEAPRRPTCLHVVVGARYRGRTFAIAALVAPLDSRLP